MKDFSWSFFWKSGQIDAYLLYKECLNNNDETELEQDEDFEYLH